MSVNSAKVFCSFSNEYAKPEKINVLCYDVTSFLSVCSIVGVYKVRIALLI